MPCCKLWIFLTWLCIKPSPPSSEHNLFLSVGQDQVEKTVPRRECASQLRTPHQRFPRQRLSQQSNQAVDCWYFTTCDSEPTPQMKHLSTIKVLDWLSFVDATGHAEFNPVPDKNLDPKF